MTQQFQWKWFNQRILNERYKEQLIASKYEFTNGICAFSMNIVHFSNTKTPMKKNVHSRI